MSRPHEDRRRHTPTDHHAGGPAIVFSPAAWWAVAVVHVTAERADAGIASYETLVEQARTSAARAHEAAILRSHNHRRVIVLLHLDGHDAFRHLSAAWDDHHLVAERHAIAESRSLKLYRLAATLGDAAIDPASTDAVAFEQISAGLERIDAVTNSLAAAPGFKGASTLSSDDDSASAIICRFARVEDIGAFRASETLYPVHVVRTFA
jgi:hypothetical protein